MLTGSELLTKVKELGDAGKTEIVRACGYVSIKKDGAERLNFTAFYEALLDATSEYPNLTILDWSTEIIANPRWLAFDKLHLQPIGYRARATMYVQAASELWSILVPPPTTAPEITAVETTTTVAG
jgi:hypothetical protein